MQDLDLGEGKEETIGLSLVPSNEKYFGSGVQLGALSEENVLPLVSLTLNKSIV